jgi:ribokinase
MIDILGLGSVAVDDLIYVEAFPAADAKVRVRRTQRQCGGLTATALVAAARLGSKCAYAGVLGTDDLSRFAIERLQQEEIELKYLRQRTGAGPIHSFIVVDESRLTRTIFFDASETVGADPQWPDDKVIQAARVLFVDTFGLEGMIRAARLARAAQIPVVADVEEKGAMSSQLLNLADHLIVSRPFAQQLTNSADPVEAAKRLWTNERTVVAITGGADGAWFLTAGGKVQHQPSFKVNVVDTTGCGDVFHGAYASMLARGADAAERIRFASAAAALKATQPGGQAGIPTLSAVELFLQQEAL